MRVLVVGGSGYVAGLFLPALARRHAIRVLDRRPPRTEAADYLADVDYLEGDALDGAALGRAAQGVDAVVALLREDARFTMPPQPLCYAGRDAVAAFFADAFGPSRLGDFRLVPTRANRQPAAANYLRAFDDTVYRALSLDVLRIEHGQLVEITTFDPSLFPRFGLPETLD